MVIYHIDMVILEIDMGDEANDMGDERIDTVISHIDMGYLVTLGRGPEIKVIPSRVAVFEPAHPKQPKGHFWCQVLSPRVHCQEHVADDAAGV